MLAGFCFAAVVFIVSIEQGTSNLKALALVQARAQALSDALASVEVTANEEFLRRHFGPLKRSDLARLKRKHPRWYAVELSLARDEAPDRAKRIASKQARELEENTLGPKSFDRAIGALLTAFVGLVMSAFLMARVGARSDVDGLREDDQPSRLLADDERSPGIRRTLWLVLLASTGLATSALFALWGLAELVDVVLADNGAVVTLVWLVFVATSILAAAFVTVAACDLRTAGSEAERSTPVLWERRVLGFASRRARRKQRQLTWLSLERIGTVAAASLGGTMLFLVAVLAYSFLVSLVNTVSHGSVVAVLAWPTARTPIDPIAIIYLLGFSVFVILALALSLDERVLPGSSDQPPDEYDVPRLLRGNAGAALTYLVVAAPFAVAWALVLRLRVGA